MNGLEAYFPRNTFDCFFEKNTDAPLVVTPREEVDLISWAKTHQKEMAAAIQEFGAIVFSGFGLKKDNFNEAFTAITGLVPDTYKGDTPRKEVKDRVYESTAVASAHAVPLHQEVSGGHRQNMPQYISFFCVTPPAAGTGRTLVGNVERITEEIQRTMPELWKNLSTKKLTYISRYLPTNSYHTKWIRRLNPSHATIQQRFGTENREEVEKKCAAEGVKCEWDGGWAVISRAGVPGTIDSNGKTLFCNAIHLDKLTPELCGAKWKYNAAITLLYQTSRSRQFDVRFDDGTEISPQDAGKLLTILNKHPQGRDWKKHDLMVINNPSRMHAKTVHTGDREILVAMAGSVLKPV